MTRSPKIILLSGTALLVSVLLFVGFLRGQNKYPQPAALAAATPCENTFFDPDPNHPWNQLYGLLFIRPARNGKLYGQDELDPLYWNSSRYLLEEPLHAKALAFLDQFIASDASRLIKDPLKRALLQRDLWALFDHCASPFFDPWNAKLGPFDVERRNLALRLVKIMRGIALTDEEIEALPHNYDREVAAKLYPETYDPAQIEQPFLPATFYAGTDWVNLEKSYYQQLAPAHTKALSGRSGFDVLLSLPGGRDATLAYLKKLNDYQPKWVYDRDKSSFFVNIDNIGDAPPYLSADLPQVPLLTRFALARRANLIDAAGKIVQSPITESIQIRVIRTELPNNSSGGEQSFFLFELDPGKLLKGEGGLVAQGKNDQGFDMVLGAGSEDPLQNRVGRNPNPEFHGEYARVESCFGCHGRAGIFSMNSYIQFFQDQRTLQPPVLAEGASSRYSLAWKEQQYDWGLLQADWFAQ